MYLDSIDIKNFRTFRNVSLKLSHQNRKPTATFPKTRFPNINLLLGNNGSGKTTLLKAIALAALGPAVADAGIYPYRLVRREPGEKLKQNIEEYKNYALIEAVFYSHPQDGIDINKIESRIKITQRGDLEQLRWDHPEEKRWHPIFSTSSDAFFFVGYGATRRVEKRERVDTGSRKQSSFSRAQRILSLFEESYSLLPLSSWLPAYKKQNPGRYTQIVHLINRVMTKDQYIFTGELEEDEYLFSRGKLKIPFPALSDGYQAFLGWIGDLLYHVTMTCPKGKKLVENHGIVMVDEIDLHIHPKWQMTVLPTLSKAFPNIQFIVTSHSPLVTGSLEWMNILFMEPGSAQSSKPKHISTGIHGLDADQILLTDFFGMKTTRAKTKEIQLQKLTKKARLGDVDAAKMLLDQLSQGMEKDK